MVHQHNALRTIIVDDTSLYRILLENILRKFSNIEIVGSAKDGEDALLKIKDLKPDLITLDVEMPRLDGIGVLQRLQTMQTPPKVLMLSSLTKGNAKTTIQALGLGAFDFITKPDGDDFEYNLQFLEQQLKSKIAALCGTLQSVAPRELPKDDAPVKQIKTTFPPRIERLPTAVEVIAIAISTGGPDALRKIVPTIPHSWNLPILIVQHMPPIFTEALANSLAEQTELTVTEAINGESPQPNHIYIAPGGKQMKAVRSGARVTLSITDDPPENFCKPAADYLFRSIADIYGSRAIGLVMTGMGRDGTSGLEVMKRSGATVIAQDGPTCTVFGMPQEAIKAGIVDYICPLEQIVSRITGLLP